MTPPWCGFPSSIARQPRGCQYRTRHLRKALAELFPTVEISTMANQPRGVCCTHKHRSSYTAGAPSIVAAVNPNPSPNVPGDNRKAHSCRFSHRCLFHLATSLSVMMPSKCPCLSSRIAASVLTSAILLATSNTVRLLGRHSGGCGGRQRWDERRQKMRVYSSVTSHDQNRNVAVSYTHLTLPTKA